MIDEKEKVSIVITAYNAEKYIKRCLDNISKQTYLNIELVLVDNGSSDLTLQLFDQYKEVNKNVVVIHKDNNIGVGDGRNTGLEYVLNNSSSKSIMFLDVDDYLHPECVNVMSKIMEAYDSDMVFTGHVLTNTFIDEFSDQINTEIEIYTDIEDFWLNRIGALAFITGRLIKKELFRHIRFPLNGLDDERTTYLLVYRSSKIALLKEKMYYWYQNPSSYMHNDWPVAKLKDQIDSVIEPFDFFYQNENYVKSFVFYYERFCELLIRRFNEIGYKRIYKDLFSYYFQRIKSYSSQYNKVNIDYTEIYLSSCNEFWKMMFRKSVNSNVLKTTYIHLKTFIKMLYSKLLWIRS